MKIEKQKSSSGFEAIVAIHPNKSFDKSSKVRDHLLFAILEKLEEVRCGLIDVEEAVNKLNPALNLTRKIGG